uniref:Uncharacterized protein n=1 Tax=Picea glauca TaxID=3330 RepID=A0A101M3X0_PICGL|nr:hypothetical protein ABT39_MTgene473 [Picea glauca]
MSKTLSFALGARYIATSIPPATSCLRLTFWLLFYQ